MLSGSLTLLWSHQPPAHKAQVIGDILRTLLSAFLKELIEELIEGHFPG